MKKVLVFIPVVLIAITFCGCIMVASQVAESGKVKQDFDLPCAQLLEGTTRALNSLQMGFDRERSEGDTVRINARGFDERTAHIVISKIGDNKSSIEIRVGTSGSGKATAQNILDAVKRSLGQ